MARIEPEEVEKAVERHMAETDGLRERMEEDYEIYRLTAFDAGEGYQNYTSNAPQTYADKIIGWLGAHELIVRVPHSGDPAEERDQNDAKERLLIGLLRSADASLVEQLVPALKPQLSWYICLRGWYAGRALLVKDEDEGTYVDVTPWDPLHTYWSKGRRGLEWACYKVRRTRDEIESEYPDFDFDEFSSNGRNPDEGGFDVYDYYDRKDNCVVIEGKFAKKPTPHGSNRVPVFLGMVGSQPPLQAWQGGRSNEELTAEYGDSVFRSNRDLYEKHNFTMSVMLEMVARARKQGVVVRSRDGSKTLEEDPYREGAEIALAEGEAVEPLGLMEIARETGAYMGLVSGELQRGSLPFSVYGELQFQLSGFAINTLRQGIQTVLQPRIEAMKSAYLQICNLLSDQYGDGGFEPMELSGWANNRQWFSEEIGYELIEGVGAPEIDMVGNLPQDEMTKMSMAQMAREGPVPLLPDLVIRDEILGLQNSDEVEAQIQEQMAERMLPEAQLWTLMKATEDRGRPDLAQFYFAQLGELMMQKQLMQQQLMQQMAGGAPLGGPGGPGGPGAPPGGPGGPQNGAGGLPPGAGGAPPELLANRATMPAGPSAPPQVMPNAGMGVPPPAPTPQGGPNVPPGNPRPGAGTQERLARIGLFGPGG